MGETVNKNVFEIVKEYLRTHGYDGLYEENGECACDLADLMPCASEGIPNCLPGYKVPCDCGDHAWHIGPTKKTASVEIPEDERGVPCRCGEILRRGMVERVSTETGGTVAITMVFECPTCGNVERQTARGCFPVKFGA